MPVSYTLDRWRSWMHRRRKGGGEARPEGTAAGKASHSPTAAEPRGPSPAPAPLHPEYPAPRTPSGADAALARARLAPAPALQRGTPGAAAPEPAETDSNDDHSARSSRDSGRDTAPPCDTSSHATKGRRGGSGAAAAAPGAKLPDGQKGGVAAAAAVRGLGSVELETGCEGMASGASGGGGGRAAAAATASGERVAAAAAPPHRSSHNSPPGAGGAAQRAAYVYGVRAGRGGVSGRTALFESSYDERDVEQRLRLALYGLLSAAPPAGGGAQQQQQQQVWGLGRLGSGGSGFSQEDQPAEGPPGIWAAGQPSPSSAALEAGDGAGGGDGGLSARDLLMGRTRRPPPWQPWLLPAAPARAPAPLTGSWQAGVGATGEEAAASCAGPAAPQRPWVASGAEAGALCAPQIAHPDPTPLGDGPSRPRHRASWEGRLVGGPGPVGVGGGGPGTSATAGASAAATRPETWGSAAALAPEARPLTSPGPAPLPAGTDLGARSTPTGPLGPISSTAPAAGPTATAAPPPPITSVPPHPHLQTHPQPLTAVALRVAAVQQGIARMSCGGGGRGGGGSSAGGDGSAGGAGSSTVPASAPAESSSCTTLPPRQPRHTQGAHMAVAAVLACLGPDWEGQPQQLQQQQNWAEAAAGAGGGGSRGGPGSLPLPPHSAARGSEGRHDEDGDRSARASSLATHTTECERWAPAAALGAAECCSGAASSVWSFTAQLPWQQRAAAAAAAGCSCGGGGSGRPSHGGASSGGGSCASGSTVAGVAAALAGLHLPVPARHTAHGVPLSHGVPPPSACCGPTSDSGGVAPGGACGTAFECSTSSGSGSTAPRGVYDSGVWPSGYVNVSASGARSDGVAPGGRQACVEWRQGCGSEGGGSAGGEGRWARAEAGQLMNHYGLVEQEHDDPHEHEDGLGHEDDEVHDEGRDAIQAQPPPMTPRVWPASGAAELEGPLARSVAERLMTRNPLFRSRQGCIREGGVVIGGAA